MTTARTHRHHVGLGPHRARLAEPKPEGYVPLVIEPAAVAEAEAEPVSPADLDFDPADYNIDEVKAYVIEHPEHAELIMELEEYGKQRSGLLSFLDNLTDPESEN